MAEFAKMLELLGRDPDERISLCMMTDRFRPIVTTVDQAAGVAGTQAEVDCWYGANPLHERVPEVGSKGFARDVIGIREVYADLDVKPGGMPDYDAAKAVIVDLAGMLGEYPAAIVSTGHGFQPHWPIERGEGTDWPDETDPRWNTAVVLNRRWHRLVLHVCEVRGGGLDNVSNLDRILRVPGTSNVHKDRADPRPVTVELPGGAPVTLERLAECLDEYGIPAMPGDDEILGEVVSEPGSWEWAERTCGYVAAMVKAWESDTPKARHPWLMSQAVRLAAAHRAGCITGEGHAETVQALTARFRWLLKNTKPDRDEHRGELAEAFTWGVARASTFPNVRHCLDAELGGHTHLDVPAAMAIEAGTVELATGLPEAFWSARPILGHIRAAAWSRGRSAEAVLVTVLARAAADTLHTVKLPAIVASECGLSLPVALAGPPGTGKSSSKGIAVELMPARVLTPDCDDVPPGSGEGLVELLFDYESEIDPDTGKTVQVKRQARYNVFVYVDEGEILATQARRNSTNTILPIIRTTFTDGTLGQANASTERKRVVPGGRYVYGIVVGIQPGKAGDLLGDAGGGTPQRFCWTPTSSPVPEPGERPAWPRALERKPLRRRDAIDGYTFAVADEVRLEVEWNDYRKQQNGCDPLDEHADLIRLKVAGILAVLDGRLDLGAEDWWLGGMVTDLSRRTRGRVVSSLDSQRRQANKARGEAEAERLDVVEDKADERAMATAKRLIVNRVVKHHREHPAGSCPRRCLDRAVAPKYRQAIGLDDVIGRAIGEQLLADTADGRFVPGVRTS